MIDFVIDPNEKAELIERAVRITRDELADMVRKTSASTIYNMHKSKMVSCGVSLKQWENLIVPTLDEDLPSSQSSASKGSPPPKRRKKDTQRITDFFSRS